MKLKNRKKKLKLGDLKYEVSKYIFDFEQYEAARSFGESIYTGTTL